MAIVLPIIKSRAHSAMGDSLEQAAIEQSLPSIIRYDFKVEEEHRKTKHAVLNRGDHSL